MHRCVTVRFKGSREIFDSGKYEITRNGETCVLVVNDVFGEDADEYSIKATTPVGSKTSRAEMSIKSQFLVAFLSLCRGQ